MDALESQLCLIRTLLRDGALERNLGLISTDIKQLPLLLEHFSTSHPLELLHWLCLLLSNPFKITLDRRDTEKILGLALGMSHKKIALKTIAALVHRTGLSYGGGTIGTKKVNELTFHMFLNSLSKLWSVGCDAISPSDSVLVKRLKVKILSRGDPQRALETYLGMLNTEDTRLSWTLCKALVRVCKHLEPAPIILSLKERCTSLFANEPTWINVITILGLMVLNGWDVGDIDGIVERALVYDNEFVPLSVNLREAAYFLLWAVTRRGGLLKNFHTVIFRALTDSSLTCRRAAASVMLEYVGRRGSQCELVRLVNFFTVRRLSRCSEILAGMDHGADHMLIENLFHYKHEIKEQSAFCLARCSNEVDVPLKTPYTGLFLLVKELAAVGRRNFGFLELEITPSLLASRDAEPLSKAYVEMLIGLGREARGEAVKRSLMSILSRNLHPLETARCCWMILDDDDAERELALGLRKNTEAFILANARNRLLEEKVEERYVQNLNGTDIDVKIHTMRAVRFTRNPRKFNIEQGLNNYYVDHRGDISWRLRKESMLAAFTAIDAPLPYFVRFFVDKSKALRDECILICRRNGIFGEGFEFIRGEGCLIDPRLFQPIRAFLDEYHRCYMATTSLGNDKLHFKAALEAMPLLDPPYLREFLAGLTRTARCSDMHAFLAEESSKYALSFADDGSTG
jgi:hypothetical protein